MTFRRLTLLAAAAAVAAVPAAILMPDRGEAAKNLSQVEAKAAAARQKEVVLTSEISKFNDKIRVVETRLAPIQAKLTALQTELTGLRVRRQKLTGELEAEQRRLQTLVNRLRAQQRALGQRISAAYRRGDPSMLQVLLQSGSVTAAMATQEGIQRSVGRDRTLITGLRTSASESKKARDTIKVKRQQVWETEKRVAAAEAEVHVVFNKVNGEKLNLVAAKNARTQLLASIKIDRKELEAEARDIRAESAKLAARINAAQSGGSTPTTVPVSGNGRFAWPVHGPVVSGFKWRWGRMHEGIDIAVGYGVPIGAAGPGTVIVSGWVGGYGNMVVISHGGSLSTAYGHMTRTGVRVGQQVSTGTFIGTVGCTGHCFGPHVHFEVRVNGQAVDPIPYL